ncbi:MAG: DEAD/DEAH box helicase [Acidimicrobiia bacterium]|nr:DEAD/DEAH box helicase [Acidimicrobiia bacterium]
MLPEGVEATFLAGDPARDGRLAFWGPGHESAPGRSAEVELVLPAGRGVRRTRVDARVAPVRDILDRLAGPLPPGVSPSVRAWAAATRAALDLAARGRLVPARSPAGWDTWRVGPFDGRHLDHLRLLAAALPPAAHAVAVPGSSPLALTAPEAVLRSFYDAVADCLVRTSSATTVGRAVLAAGPRGTAGPLGAGAFAGTEPVAVPAGGAAARWLDGVAPARLDQPTVALRLEPPDGIDDPFAVVVQVHSSIDPGLVTDAEALWAASGPVAARFGARAEEAVLLCLRRGAWVFPALHRLLDEARPGRLVLDDDEVEELLGPTAAELAGAGLEVLWPAELTAGLTTRTVVGTPQPTPISSGGGVSLRDLVEVRYEALLDGHALTAAELEELAEAKRPMVRLRGRFVVVDPALVARLRARHTVTAAEALARALDGALDDALDDGGAVADLDSDATIGADPYGPTVVVGPWAELAGRLRLLTAGRELPEPPGLAADLRHYQRRGLGWLTGLADLGLGGCLADDMGLGKTVQIIAAHLHLAASRGSRPTLVVCPASLMANWEREIARFAPGLPHRRYHGPARTLASLAPDEIVVTTYGVTRRDQAELAAVPWGLAVADEAQHVKNPLSAAARALRQVPSEARFAVTGTPVENRLSELWALLDWSTPGLLPPLERFQREVAGPIERQGDEAVAARLARVVQPFLLRRRKTDPGIAPELPPKTEADVPVLLSAEQATLYKAVVDDALDRIAEADGIARRGLVFRLLTALKQICNHPAHYLGQVGPLPGRSGKLEAAEELAAAAVAGGESVLVFTQYVAMGRLLGQRLSDLGVSSGFLHGSLAVARRQELVDEFQAGRFPVLVLSLKAGGTGLNLTRATQVVHYDRWWNPAVEDQASDRAWRIGQDRAVFVHRLLTEGTVEEKVAATLAAKRQLAASVTGGGGEGWIAELSDDELGELLRLGSGG